jgi:hypothetical protein
MVRGRTGAEREVFCPLVSSLKESR